MNERIRELAEQAGYLEDMFGIGHWDMPECKKFAELIVRECAEIVEETRWAVQPSQEQIANSIRRHFGVE